MKLLVFGGSGFLSWHVASEAVARGHEVTAMTRGARAGGVPDGVAHVRGDRDGELDALGDARWDAVIDVCGFVPRVVGASARLLAERVDHYVYVSSISAYAAFPAAGYDETAPLAALDDPATEDVEAHYGALKAACERAVDDALPGRATHVRAGLIAGPRDHTDRFTYWPWRLARGGRVLAPGTPGDPVQVIDARDLAAWTISMAERRIAGAFNATSPAGAHTIGSLIDACRTANAELVWVPWPRLQELGVQPWTDLPTWVPPTGESAGVSRADTSRAIAAGLTCRSLSETAADTLAWLGPRTTLAAGLAPPHEQSLLAAL